MKAKFKILVEKVEEAEPKHPIFCIWITGMHLLQ